MRTILITGATDGLGRHLAGRLAARGERVIVHGRNADRVRRVRAEIGGNTEEVLADLADLHQVDRMASEVEERFERLDVLVNNAGIGGGTAGSGRQESADGIELRFAVNYLAGYHLARRLVPLLVRSAPSRVVNVASLGQQAIDFDDPMLTRGYGRQRAYAQSKLAQIMFTFDLAEELAGQGVSVTTLHPATFMDTTMVREAGVPALASVDQGGDATLRLVDEDVPTGGYFDGKRAATADPQAYDVKARARLRELSDELIRQALTR
ncbi:3-oxoacyl-ACP reductase [Planotetraspora thailandica]|uniref:3-oxoacyl-ACP reductase n=1 Tax=Planotetraspora thailandica TaxID=487172 RepID=A0A8J3V6C4_9ACTN|nr:SDR family NAD(P)-dependent oxidoreductase [Planotetraspora thailandica]GII54824.1 3-oxoacyl-ACP reductase [Planotetraspora thailandica]